MRLKLIGRIQRIQGWPEYSEPGDWLNYNAGVLPTAHIYLPSQREQDDLPAVPSNPVTPPAIKN